MHAGLGFTSHIYVSVKVLRKSSYPNSTSSTFTHLQFLGLYGVCLFLPGAWLTTDPHAVTGVRVSKGAEADQTYTKTQTHSQQTSCAVTHRVSLEFFTVVDPLSQIRCVLLDIVPQDAPAASALQVVEHLDQGEDRAHLCFRRAKWQVDELLDAIRFEHRCYVVANDLTCSPTQMQ